MESERIVREIECKRLTGLSRGTRWRLEKTDDFPKRRQIGPNSVGWRLGEIIEWIESRPRSQGS